MKAGIHPEYAEVTVTCVCGHSFGDPRQRLTDETVNALREARRGHFRLAFRVRDEGWYPGEGTMHYNLHRAVQEVIKEQFPEATEFAEEMVAAVAEYLRIDAKGITHAGKPVDAAAAVAACKKVGRVELSVTGDALHGQVKALRKALGDAGIRVLSRSP